MIQLFWAVGSIIVGGVTYHYEQKSGSVAYRYGPSVTLSTEAPN